MYVRMPLNNQRGGEAFPLQGLVKREFLVLTGQRKENHKIMHQRKLSQLNKLSQISVPKIILSPSLPSFSIVMY